MGRVRSGARSQASGQVKLPVRGAPESRVPSRVPVSWVPDRRASTFAVFAVTLAPSTTSSNPDSVAGAGCAEECVVGPRDALRRDRRVGGDAPGGRGLGGVRGRGGGVGTPTAASGRGQGMNAHHQCETIFKAFARALRVSLEIDPRAAGVIPSTKGVL